MGAHHSTGCSLNRKGAGDFHRPYETQKSFPFTIHRGTLPQSRPIGRASSLREGAGERSHSSGYSLKSGVAGDFHRPYENSECFTAKKIFRFLTQKRYRVGCPRMGTSEKRN